MPHRISSLPNGSGFVSSRCSPKAPARCNLTQMNRYHRQLGLVSILEPEQPQPIVARAPVAEGRNTSTRSSTIGDE